MYNKRWTPILVEEAESEYNLYEPERRIKINLTEEFELQEISKMRGMVLAEISKIGVIFYLYTLVSSMDSFLVLPKDSKFEVYSLTECSEYLEFEKCTETDTFEEAKKACEEIICEFLEYTEELSEKIALQISLRRLKSEWAKDIEEIIVR